MPNVRLPKEVGLLEEVGSPEATATKLGLGNKGQAAKLGQTNLVD